MIFKVQKKNSKEMVNQLTQLMCGKNVMMSKLSNISAIGDDKSLEEIRNNKTID